MCEELKIKETINSVSSDTKFFVTFFTSVDATCYDWCIIKVVLLVSHIALITICYHNLTLLL